jgi:hypothetical protein
VKSKRLASEVIIFARSKLTLSSSPCAPTNQTVEISELNSCDAILQAFTVMGRFQRGSNVCARSLKVPGRSRHVNPPLACLS